MDSMSTVRESIVAPVPATDAEMKSGKWRVERCLIEGYFCQVAPDPNWPSVEDVERAYNFEGMMEYFSSCWPWDPSAMHYEISLNRVLRSLQKVEAFEREYIIREAVAKVNKAWQTVMQVTAFQDKTARMQSVVNEQADAMLRKLHIASSSSKKLAATEQWRTSKLEELQLQMQKMDNEGLVVLNEAVAAMLHVWGRVREQIQSRRASLASSSSMEPLQDEDMTVPAAGLQACEAHEGEEHFDESEFLKELEDGMGSLTLEAQPFLVMKRQYYSLLLG